MDPILFRGDTDVKQLNVKTSKRLKNPLLNGVRVEAFNGSRVIESSIVPMGLCWDNTDLS